MKMIKNFINKRGGNIDIFFLHSSVNHLDNILVEMVDEVSEVGLVGVWTETLPTHPVHGVALTDPATPLQSGHGQRVPDVGEEAARLLVHLVVHQVYEG